MKRNASSFAGGLWDRDRKISGPPDKDDDAALRSDPLADLMFTMIAIVLLALILVLPFALVGGAQSAGSPGRGSLDDVRFKLRGQSALWIVATRSGLVIEGRKAPARIGIDAIGTSQGLRARLVKARAAKRPLIFLVADDGLEAAFATEPIIAALGPIDFYQIRLDRSCRAARSAAARRLCAEIDALERGRAGK